MAIDHVEAIRSEASALGAAARSAPLTTPVPTCPGWDVGRLVGHLGRVHRWAAAAAAAGGEPVDARGLPKPPTDEAELLAWFDEGADALVTTLAAIEPGAPAWNFAGATPTAAFWRRRQAVETAVHRWDAEHAVGTASPVEAQLAADGIDEFLTVLAPYRFASEDGIDLGGSLHLHCTDVDGEWTIHTDDGVYRIDRGHAKGDVAVRGPASQLLLVVFQRLGPEADDIEVFGAPEILDRWLALGTL